MLLLHLNDNIVTNIGIADNGYKQMHRCQLRRFALRFIHSRSDTTGVFRSAFREIVTLMTYGNRVRHILSSQDERIPLPGVTGTLITTDREQGILDLVVHNVLIFVLINPPVSACECRSCYSRLSYWLQRDTLARKRQWRRYANE